MLVILGGLPATGKSTVASELNKGGAFSYVRIDALEQALRDSGEMQACGVQGAGYMVGYAVAGNLLDGSNNVLVECVNPIEVTRAAWRDVAASHGAGLLEVELFCSDGKVHRARAESPTITVPGLTPPTWEEIEAREFEPWPADGLVPINEVSRIITVSTSLIGTKAYAWPLRDTASPPQCDAFRVRRG